jgi:hypothetical protein
MIPDTLCTYLLELLAQTWLYCTQLPISRCMITFIEPPLSLTLCAPIGATCIMLHSYFNTQERKIVGLITLYILLMAIFSLHPQPTSIKVPYGNKTIIIHQYQGKLIMIDSGFPRRINNINQWIQYTLLPTLGNTFGRQTIDSLIIHYLKQQGIVTSVVLEDGPVKTMPSFHASPLDRSKSPSFQNLPAPQHQVLPDALQQ